MASTLLVAPRARSSVLALSMVFLAACGGSESTSSGGTGGALGGGVSSSVLQPLQLRGFSQRTERVKSREN